MGAVIQSERSNETLALPARIVVLTAGLVIELVATDRAELYEVAGVKRQLPLRSIDREGC
jgi:hypothetical protein